LADQREPLQAGHACGVLALACWSTPYFCFEFWWLDFVVSGGAVVRDEAGRGGFFSKVEVLQWGLMGIRPSYGVGGN
jgi:hypothetical protein